MSRKVIDTYQCEDLEETLAEFINKIPKEHIPYIKLGIMHFESDLYSYTNLPKDFLSLDEEVGTAISFYFNAYNEVLPKSELIADIKNSDVVFLYTPYEIACCVNKEGVDSAVSVVNCLAELKERYNADALETSLRIRNKTSDKNNSKNVFSEHFASLDF